MPTTPQDRKSKAESANESFEFTRDGVTYTLPPSSAIKAGMLRRLRKLDDLDMAFSLIEEIADPAALAALDDASIDEFNEILAGWQRHIGFDAGN